jgi:hypothetical protein
MVTRISVTIADLFVILALQPKSSYLQSPTQGDDMKSIASLVIVCVSLVSCSSIPGKIDENTKETRNVAIVGLVENSIPVSRIGLTVFNNATVAIRPREDLNNFIAEEISLQLKSLRPNWNVYVVQPSQDLLDRLSRLDAKHAGGDEYQLVIHDAAVPALGAGADLVLVALPAAPQYSPFRNSSGVLLRTLSLSKVDSARVFGAVSISATSKSGKISASNSAPDGFYFIDFPASDLKLSYELNSVSSGPTPALVEAAVHKQISRNISEVLSRLLIR